MVAIDHLILVAPDLDSAVADLEARLGVRASAGGRHPAWATHNALLALGDDLYLEILAPDPSQPRPATPRFLGLDDVESPRLATWAARGSNLEALVAQARSRGLDLGVIRPGSRRGSDGSVVSWRATAIEASRMGGVVPFLIDWGDSQHPAPGASRGCTLIELRAAHPEPGRARAALASLGLDLRVDRDTVPGLIATVDAPRGPVEIR